GNTSTTCVSRLLRLSFPPARLGLGLLERFDCIVEVLLDALIAAREKPEQRAAASARASQGIQRPLVAKLAQMQHRVAPLFAALALLQVERVRRHLVDFVVAAELVATAQCGVAQLDALVERCDLG